MVFNSTVSLLGAVSVSEIITSVLMLLAGCGVFMTGMKLMSEGLERSAGKGMRKLFQKISNNRFAGIGVGAAATAIIQSSSATTVMIIGFVNAGLMTLFQATSIIMGANIGTTVTGLLVSLSAFKIDMYAAALSLVGVLIMMFAKNDTLKKVGTVLTGLGLIFVGLYLMSSAFKNSALSGIFSNVFQVIDFPLLLILLGVVFTALLQSSSATTGLIITMVGQAVMPLKSALFIVLGTNIGTCITALLASVGATTNAKRAALIHLIFNVIGSAVFTVFIWIFSNQVVWLLQTVISSPQMQIAWFHVAFNLVTTLLLVPFISQLTRLATFMVKDKKNGDDELKMYYIDDRILHTPPIAVAQVLKEVANMSEMARDNLERAMNALLKQDLADKDKIRKEEEKINFINKGVARYLIKMSSLSLSKSDEKLVGSLHHVISDIERIGDHAENFLEEAEEMTENNVAFSVEAVDELSGMYKRVREMFDTAIEVFENRDVGKLKKVSEMEAHIDMLKRLLGNNHIMRLNNGNCTVESGTYFYALITALERVADHLTNVAFSIRSASGSQLEAMARIAEENAKKHPANG